MSKKEKIYGMMNAKTVRVPYTDPEEKKRHDEINASMKGIAQVFKGATDWAFRRYEDTATKILANKPLQKFLPRKDAEDFRSGDLVTIFKNVTDGDVCWQGTVDLDRSAYHHGYQKGMSSTTWSGMFFDQLPVKLERDGKTIFAAMEPFCETGTEGVVWSVHEYGKTGYDGLIVLENGDKLTVYSEVRDGAIEWQGRLDFGPEKLEKIGNWTDVLRCTNHMDTKKWLELSYQNRPVVIIR